SYLASVAAALALAACTTPREANAPPSASTSMLSCSEGAPPPIVVSRNAREHMRASACANIAGVNAEARPPRSGPSSETAALGQELFDAGRYGEAIEPLRQTADALTGDEKAQRQMARLRLAIALLRTGEERQGAAILATIAVDPLDAAHLALLAWVTDEAQK